VSPSISAEIECASPKRFDSEKLREAEKPVSVLYCADGWNTPVCAARTTTPTITSSLDSAGSNCRLTGVTPRAARRAQAVVERSQVEDLARSREVARDHARRFGPAGRRS
jgi:hypothetical protein